MARALEDDDNLWTCAHHSSAGDHPQFTSKQDGLRYVVLISRDAIDSETNISVRKSQR